MGCSESMFARDSSMGMAKGTAGSSPLATLGYYNRVMSVMNSDPIVMHEVLDAHALGVHLRMLRERIPATAQMLGLHQRLAVRRGRRVTQEEIAEVVGVSRGWYRRLECGAGARASIKLLARLSDALMLTADERSTLFALALPEMQAPALS